MFLHCPGANNTFGARDIDYGMLAEARLFHFGYPPLLRKVIENEGRELAEIFRRAKATGITTSLDMSMPDPKSFSGQVDWRAIVRATLPYVDVFLPSLEETLFMLYPERFRALTQARAMKEEHMAPEVLSSIGSDLLAMGPAIVGLKLGPMGLYLKTAGKSAWAKFGRTLSVVPGSWIERELWSPCFKVDVVGTTGAGDATIAGFLAALLHDCSPEEAVTMACAVGGCNVEAADALGGIRSWDETRSRLNAGWPRRALEPEPSGWRLLPDTGTWSGPSDSLSGRKPEIRQS
jgi:sugar/nucleoside kinase (ribokinase family)